VRPPDREPPPRRGAALRRVLAGLIVALLAALTPVMSAAPAGAARASGRAISAPATTATTHSTPTTGQQSRRGLRSVGHQSPGTAGRRVAEKAGALRPAHRHGGRTVVHPTRPASSSIDATGPPSSYPLTTVSSSRQRLGGCHYPAAAGRAPPHSSGS